MASLIQTLLQSVSKKKSAGTLLKSANHARDTKSYAEAARLYEAYLALDPLNGPIHVQCGHMNKEIGSLSEAKRHYFIAYALMPNDADLQIQLGHYHKITGQLEDAVSFYRRASELNPGDDFARMELTTTANALEQANIFSKPKPLSDGDNQRAVASFRRPAFDLAAQDPGPKVELGATSRSRDRSKLMGHFDSFDDGIALGWAYDANHPWDPLTLHVVIDGKDVATVECTERRADIQANLSHPTGKVGFRFETPLTYYDGNPHTIGFRTLDGKTVTFVDAERPDLQRDLLAFDGKLQAKVHGVLDGLRKGKFHGWALRKEPRDRRIRELHHFGYMRRGPNRAG